MPVVPVLNSDQVKLDPMTDAKFRPADFGSAGETIGKAAAGSGKALGDFAETQDKINAVHDEAAAKKLDNDAVERMRAILWTGDNAFYSKEGFDAGNARPTTEKAIKDLRGELLGQATTERQKRMFGEVFDRRSAQEFEGIARYSIGQVSKEEERQSIARGINAATEAVTYADDPVRSETAIQTGLGEISSRADKQGWSPDVRKAEAAKYVSGIRAQQIDAKHHDAPTAMALLERYHSQLLPEDEQKLRDTLYQPMMERQGVADVDGLMSVDTDALPEAPKDQPGQAPTLARMQQITAFSESRNRDRKADGSIVTSSAGAQGRMQVMPGTNRDPGYGVTPARDGGDEERARVGRDYLAALTKHYGGDPTKAWAAYNWGPGNLDNAIAAHGAGWFAHAPKETKDYVATNTAALGGETPGQGRYAPRQDDLAGIYARIDAQPWDFERKQAARNEADHRVARNDMLLRRQEASALDDAYRTITPLGDNFTSVNQLPPEVRRRLSPEALNRLTEQARANAKPAPIAANGDTALALSLMKTYEPEKFAQTDLRLYRDKVTPSEFSSIAEAQAAIRTNPKAPVSVQHDAIWGTISKYGPDVGIDPKKIGKEGSAARADAMRVFSMMKTDLDGKTDGKRQPSDDEVKAAWDRAVIDVKVAKPGLIWGENVNEKKRFQVPEGQGYRVEVPNPVRDRIISSFQRRTGRAPNEAEVAQTYVRFKGEPGFW